MYLAFFRAAMVYRRTLLDYHCLIIILLMLCGFNLSNVAMVDVIADD